MLSSPSTQCDRDDAAKEADWSWRMSLLHLCAEATRGAELWPGQFEMARNTKAAGALLLLLGNDEVRTKSWCRGSAEQIGQYNRKHIITAFLQSILDALQYFYTLALPLFRPSIYPSPPSTMENKCSTWKLSDCGRNCNSTADWHIRVHLNS